MPEATPQTAPVKLTTIRHAIVHTMVVQGAAATLDAREKELEITDLAQKLVDTLYSTYRSKPSKSYGRFNGDQEKAPSQVHAKTYLLEKKGDFCAFTKRMGKLLCDKVQGVAATSAHVFFAHVDGDGREFLIIAIVTDEIDIALNAKKELKEAEHLDLKGFRFAGRIDVTAWREHTDRYVSFLKGTKDPANYFMAFLGCDTAIPNLADSQYLAKTLQAFAAKAERDGKPLTEAEQNEWLWKVDAHCLTMIKENEPLNIQAFCNALWPEDPGALSKAIVDSDYPIGDGIALNKRGLMGLVHFRGKAKHWELKFDREALNERDVRYNPDDGTITLSGVPADLAARLHSQNEDQDD